jgi:hypothetical protein
MEKYWAGRNNESISCALSTAISCPCRSRTFIQNLAYHVSHAIISATVSISCWNCCQCEWPWLVLDDLKCIVYRWRVHKHSFNDVAIETQCDGYAGSKVQYVLICYLSQHMYVGIQQEMFLMIWYQVLWPQPTYDVLNSLLCLAIYKTKHYCCTQDGILETQ